MSLNINMTRELTESEFKRTFGDKMLDVTGEESDSIDIWIYVKELNRQYSNLDKIYQKGTIEIVYRTKENTYDHVLLPNEQKNNYLVIIVDLVLKRVFGHYYLDLNKEYGIK